MLKKIIIFSLAVFLTGLIAWPLLTLAQGNIQTCPPNDDGTPKTLKECQEWALGQVGEKSGYGGAGEVESTDLSLKIGQIISYVLAFLGVAFLVIVVYSGIQWMTAGGNEEAVKKARTRLVNATIGLAIVMAAYAISWYVVTQLQSAVPEAGQGSEIASCSAIENAEDCDGHFCIWSAGECQLYVATVNACQPLLEGDCGNVNGQNCGWNEATNQCEYNN